VAIEVRVRNFQSVEDAKLTIDGLTVVTGTNNAGKSAFFRAIRGAFTNARGYDFVRHGKSNCQVDIKFDDGKTLTWKKGKNENTYIVNGGKPFEKVGHGVPPEAKTFGIESVTAGKTELWPQIAPQITGVSFLLHEPGSVIAEAVADVKRVNQLSRALAACEKDKRAGRASLKVRRKDAKTLAGKREGFAGLDDVVGEITALETRRSKAEKVTKAITNVAKLQRRHKAAREAVEQLQGLEDAEGAVPATKRVKDAEGVSKALKEATKLQGRYQNAKAEVEALEALDEAEKAVPDAAQAKKAQKLGSGLRGAVKLQGRYKAAKAEVAVLEGLGDAEEALPSDARFQYAQQFRKGVQVTVELAMKYEEARKEFELAEKAQEALEAVDLDDKLVDRAGKFKKAIGNAVSLKVKYVKNRDAVADLEQQIADQEKELAELNETLVSVLGDVDECPTCGGGLDHVH
jgi:tetratricopeptide (TPR) repeat protein